jgi:hypothetical protein
MTLSTSLDCFMPCLNYTLAATHKRVIVLLPPASGCHGVKCDRVTKMLTEHVVIVRLLFLSYPERIQEAG